MYVIPKQPVETPLEKMAFDVASVLASFGSLAATLQMKSHIEKGNLTIGEQAAMRYMAVQMFKGEKWKKAN